MEHESRAPIALHEPKRSWLRSIQVSGHKCHRNMDLQILATGYVPSYSKLMRATGKGKLWGSTMDKSKAVAQTLSSSQSPWELFYWIRELGVNKIRQLPIISLYENENKSSGAIWAKRGVNRRCLASLLSAVPENRTTTNSRRRIANNIHYDLTSSESSFSPLILTVVVSGERPHRIKCPIVICAGGAASLASCQSIADIIKVWPFMEPFCQQPYISPR